MALLLWTQYTDGALSDGPWLTGILAIAGLLILAAHRPSQKSLEKKQAFTGARERRGLVKASVTGMYTSARNMAEAFFKHASEKTRDPQIAKNLNFNRAHLVRVFAYLGPKFVLNVRVKEFHKTRADGELTSIATDGFKAITEFEEGVFQSLLPVEIASAFPLPSDSAVADAQDIIDNLNSIFAECSSNIIANRPFPLDPLFKEFDTSGPLAKDEPASRHDVYQPLFKNFYAIWADCDVVGLDLSSSSHLEPNPKSEAAVDLDQALDDLLNSLETSSTKRPNTVLPARTDLKRAILIVALHRDERTGLAALYDEQLSRADIERRSKQIRGRVARLIDELGKTSGQRVERLFERLCGERSDLRDLEKIVRTSSSRYQNLPPLT